MGYRNGKRHNRKNLTAPEKIIGEYEKLTANLDIYKGKNITALYQEAHLLAEKLISATKEHYDMISGIYSEKRGIGMNAMDEKLWGILESYIQTRLSLKPEQTTMQDVATGHGRDFVYAKERGYEIHGIDSSSKLIEMLRSRAQSENWDIPDDRIKESDMRETGYASETFHIVRHNASLVHLPMLDKNFTADKALYESHRILKPNGLLFILVKLGDGIKFLDTNENLGGRVFQFYTHKKMNELLTRNKFNIIYMSEEEEQRNTETTRWLAFIAQKV